VDNTTTPSSVNTEAAAAKVRSDEERAVSGELDDGTVRQLLTAREVYGRELDAVLCQTNHTRVHDTKAAYKGNRGELRATSQNADIGESLTL
jgi:hypothetical protein